MLGHVLKILAQNLEEKVSLSTGERLQNEAVVFGDVKGAPTL
jgi:hypothetical protein